MTDTATLLAGLEAINDIVERSVNILGDENASLVEKHAITSPTDLKKAFSDLQEQDRLLEVGIVGRVKAGKSSLLNALFFDGQSVLPKAATPMTAALTTMTWGERLSATVELYSTGDIKVISDRAAEYKSRLESLTDKYVKEIIDADKKRAKSKIDRMVEQTLSNLDPKTKEQALKKAQRELAGNQQLAEAHDQQLRLSKRRLDRAGLGDQIHLEADNLHQLKDQLGEYVGSQGLYMPFTRAVHLTLPFEELRDLRVIDTPGLNDPVPSREKRTNELLALCDVIFIVSPAGQFLSSNDLELMGRITEKEGVRELYLVASQVDTQLFGSAKRPLIQGALENVLAPLGEHARSTLETHARKQPESADALRALMTDATTRIIPVSGMAHLLAIEVERVGQLGSGETTVWQNLTQNYPDQFREGDVELSRASLSRLANLDPVRHAMNDARGKKADILEQKLFSLVEAKQRSADAYRDDLEGFTAERIRVIGEYDLSDLQDQRQQLERAQVNIGSAISTAYEDKRFELLRILSEEMNGQLRKRYNEAMGKKEAQVASESYTYTDKKIGVGNWFARTLWGGGTKTVTGTRTTVNTAPVYQAMNRFVRDLERELADAAQERKLRWRKDLLKSLTLAYRSAVDDSAVDETLILRSIARVINQIPLAEFKAGLSIPDDLAAQGTLSGKTAEEFVTAADRFMLDVEGRFARMIADYRSQLENSVPASVTNQFLESVTGQLEQLEEDLRNRAEALDRLARIRGKLKQVKFS